MRIRPVPRSRSVSGSGAGLMRASGNLASGGGSWRAAEGDRSIAEFAELISEKDQAGTEWAETTKRDELNRGGE